MHRRLTTLVVRLTVFALCALMLGDWSPATVTAQDEKYWLPWEAGSIWQITSDNSGGNHADKWNEYAFDAVPDPGRSTPNVTAIADGTVLGFQNDIPKSALFAQGHAGNCMLIRHADGRVSLYAHLAAGSIPTEVRQVGAAVRSGMVIGVVGDTGYAAGVHLHWSLSSRGFMFESEGYLTCAGESVPSQYSDNDAELIEDGGVPRTGRFYESTNGRSSAVQQPVSPPPVVSAPNCNDAGIPQITNGLTYSPANPDTTTEVKLSFTITNVGCGTFRPEVLSIGGRNPNGDITDPLQIREFVLGPGESRDITQTTVLNSPGTHEFFMAFLRAGGGWNRIPNPAGDSSSIYVNVAEAASGGAVTPDQSTTAPPNSTEEAPAADQFGDVAPMDIGAMGPNGHEIGAQFTVTSVDGTWIGSCILEGRGDEPYLVTCPVEVPRNTTVVVTLDVNTITPGYVPVENPLYFDTSGNPGAASHWGVGFQIVAQGGMNITGQTSDIAIQSFLDGAPYYDACYILVGYSLEGCDANRDGMITFADIPFGTYTVTQTASLPSGYSIPDFTITVTGAGQGGTELFPAYIESSTAGASPPPIADPPVQSGSVNIALITRDPADGRLLTDVCYVLAGYSLEGCDQNGDGQVTFADIPYGTYTVHQTRTPAGYPVVEDYQIQVKQPGYMEGPVSTSSLGFVVKQAAQQNAPNTRNVSIVFLDMFTSERVTTGVCVELVGASLVGCDEDLIDGQVDFLDVRAGGPYELRFSNLPPGYEVGTVGGPLAVTVPAGSGDPANVMVFVLLGGSQGGGSPMIQSVNNSQSGTVQGSVSSSGGAGVTVVMTFRGCPEGFVPGSDDPFIFCTIPLDAPDAALAGEAGLWQSFVSIAALERQYGGQYVFRASASGGFTLELTGLEPVLRDDFLVYGVDGQQGSSYTTLLIAGETREIFVFYYYYR